MLTANFNHTIESWIADVRQYDLRQLCAQPAAGSWSLGQVTSHLVNDTHYYFGQIKICVACNDNVPEEAAAFAKSIFLNNAFPDEQIKGNPANENIPQPASKEQLLGSLKAIQNELAVIESLIAQTTNKGKTKHPGLGYFNATEWLQFAEIHFRHHIRQKKRLSDFLRLNR